MIIRQLLVWVWVTLHVLVDLFQGLPSNSRTEIRSVHLAHLWKAPWWCLNCTNVPSGRRYLHFYAGKQALSLKNNNIKALLNDQNKRQSGAEHGAKIYHHHGEILDLQTWDQTENIWTRSEQKFLIIRHNTALSNLQNISVGFTQWGSGESGVCPQGVMNLQDTYPQTKYSDPEFQQSPILFNKSTWIAAEEDSVSHAQVTSCHHHHDNWLGAKHLDVSILELQLANSLTQLGFINFTGKCCFYTASRVTTVWKVLF